MNTTRSDALFARAQRVIPGGVNSPVRAMRSVGRTPLFIQRGKGSHLWDVDGNELIDYVGSWGPLLLGHNRPEVLQAVQEAAVDGTSFGAATEREVRIAELIRSMVPGIEMVRMVNSGTEATMSAIRLARAYTGREKIVKFEGCYHGHADPFLIKAGSGALTFGVPDSPGVPRATGADTLNARYNDLESVRRHLEALPGQIAGIIVEPVAGNMGCVPPAPGFLQGLRSLCDQHSVVLIFDEVMTGFRVAPGGAQELFAVRPDLTTLGKIIGAGLPVGAYGGKREIMELVSPVGPMYQAGTLSGNPLAMAAGIAMLELLSGDPSIYQRIEESAARLESGLRAIITRDGYTLSINRVGSMMTLFFTSGSVVDYESARRCDTVRFGAYFRGMLERGIYLPASQFEALFVSLAHSEADIDRTLHAAEESLRAAFQG
jgi:glutamate-1-semialdehyde 2,1-aminomutase